MSLVLSGDAALEVFAGPFAGALPFGPALGAAVALVESPGTLASGTGDAGDSCGRFIEGSVGVEGRPAV